MKKEKSNDEILLGFMKSNKVRRQKLAEKEGFNDVAKYKEYLEMKVQLESSSEEESEETSDIKINHIAVMDCSASMASGRLAIAKEGLREDFNNNLSDNYQLIRFGSTVKPIQELRENIISGLTSTLGMTALISATTRAIEVAVDKASEDNKYLIKVFTDGGENVSKREDIKGFKTLLKYAESLGITVTFIGPDSTLTHLIDQYGVDESNVLGHDNTQESITESFNSMNVATRTYASKAMAGEDVTSGFYKDLK